MYLYKMLNVLVQIDKCICPNWKTYFSLPVLILDIPHSQPCCHCWTTPTTWAFSNKSFDFTSCYRIVSQFQYIDPILLENPFPQPQYTYSDLLCIKAQVLDAIASLAPNPGPLNPWPLPLPLDQLLPFLFVCIGPLLNFKNPKQLECKNDNYWVHGDW